MTNFSDWIRNEMAEGPKGDAKVDFIMFLDSGEIKVIADGRKETFIVDGVYIRRFREEARRNPLATYQKLKDWTRRGLAQEI